MFYYITGLRDTSNSCCEGKGEILAEQVQRKAYYIPKLQLVTPTFNRHFRMFDTIERTYLSPADLGYIPSTYVALGKPLSLSVSSSIKWG